MHKNLVILLLLFLMCRQLPAQPVPCIRPVSAIRLSDERISFGYNQSCDYCQAYDLNKIIDNDRGTHATLFGQKPNVVNGLAAWTPVIELAFNYTSQQGDLLYFGASNDLIIGCFDKNNHLLLDILTSSAALPVILPAGVSKLQVRINVNPDPYHPNDNLLMYVDYVHMERPASQVSVLVQDCAARAIKLVATGPASAASSWYTQERGGAAIATGEFSLDLITRAEVDTVFYLETIDSTTGCAGTARKPVPVNVLPNQKTLSALQINTNFSKGHPVLLNKEKNEEYTLVNLFPTTERDGLVASEVTLACFLNLNAAFQVKNSDSMSHYNTNAIIRTTDGGYMLSVFSEPLEDGFPGRSSLAKVSAGSFSNGKPGISSNILLQEEVVSVRSWINTPDGGSLLLFDATSGHSSKVARFDGKGKIIWNADHKGDYILPPRDNEYSYLLLGAEYEPGIDSVVVVAKKINVTNGSLIADYSQSFYKPADVSNIDIIDFKKALPTQDGGYLYAASKKQVIRVGNLSSLRDSVVASDFLVIKVDSTYRIQWTRTYGGSGVDELADMVITDDGNYLLAGTSNSQDGDVRMNYGSNDYLLMEIGEGGNLIEQYTIGDGLDNRLNCIIRTGQKGTYALAGTSGAETVIHKITLLENQCD